MDTREILAAVKAEVSRLNKVVALLEGGGNHNKPHASRFFNRT
jgi:hypothetical protein